MTKNPGWEVEGCQNKTISYITFPFQTRLELKLIYSFGILIWKVLGFKLSFSSIKTSSDYWLFFVETDRMDLSVEIKVYIWDTKCIVKILPIV